MRKSRTRTGARRRDRAALSSVYGFIMIYLLVVASLQAISLSTSSAERADSASQQAGQIAQQRPLENLKVTTSGGNVTVTNYGLIDSDVSYLLLEGPGGSVQLPVGEEVAAGQSITIRLDASYPAVAAVTSLGNVFASSSEASGPPAANSTTLESPVGGPGVDGQIYQNPGSPGNFFLALGDTASDLSSLTGQVQWTFDAGQGEVTDILPLSGGGVYVSDGYYGDQFTSTLFRLTSAGTSVQAYTMRLYRLWTTVEVQYPNGGLPPWPSGSQPVEKGEDSTYAYYDGWFFTADGQSSTTVPGDSYELGPTDGSDFYLFSIVTNPGKSPCIEPSGNTAFIYDYSASSNGISQSWSTPIYFDSCDFYPNELISSVAESGTIALLFSQTYWSQPNYDGGPYQGANPFLAVLTAGGTVTRSQTLDASGYTSVATDGSHVYLAIPSSQLVEVVGVSGTAGGSFYNVGIPGSTLLWEYGSLFVVSSEEVKVYSSSMALEATLNFSPYSFYSLSTSKPTEPQMVSPSFLVLNSTTYAALLRNSTGYGTLVMGRY